jgi:hypothetical protein
MWRPARLRYAVTSRSYPNSVQVRASSLDRAGNTSITSTSDPLPVYPGGPSTEASPRNNRDNSLILKARAKPK